MLRETVANKRGAQTRSFIIRIGSGPERRRRDGRRCQTRENTNGKLRKRWEFVSCSLTFLLLRPTLDTRSSSRETSFVFAEHLAIEVCSLLIMQLTLHSLIIILYNGTTRSVAWKRRAGAGTGAEAEAGAKRERRLNKYFSRIYKGSCRLFASFTLSRL